MSINSSIGWLEITASPLVPFYASHLKQKLKESKASALMAQSSALTLLKSFDTVNSYIRLPKGTQRELSPVAFADPGHSDSASQLCYIVGFVIGNVKQSSFFHVLTWSSHKSKRLVRSTGAAEIVAAVESIEEVFLLNKKP